MVRVVNARHEPAPRRRRPWHAQKPFVREPGDLHRCPHQSLKAEGASYDRVREDIRDASTHNRGRARRLYGRQFGNCAEQSCYLYRSSPRCL